MLSPPKPCVEWRSGERQWSRSSSMIPDSGLPAFRNRGNRSLMKSTASWLPTTSQMPSQARRMNSSPATLRTVSTSGVAEIICSQGCSIRFFLYSRSPMDRDKFRLPHTRYWTMLPTCCLRTSPPALVIRSRSPGRFGLWSSERGTAWPFRESTHRLSPALATTSASGRTRQTTAVQPTQSGLTSRTPREGLPSARVLLRTSCSSKSMSSMVWKAVTREP
mmetsp:Transcript_48643/g.143584  ORF Transcript_48643/g.143584 Transcript_48643/m.143584 type:complete len:220 (-) Transcript_48643:337-996(-)